MNRVKTIKCVFITKVCPIILDKHYFLNKNVQTFFSLIKYGAFSIVVNLLSLVLNYQK